MTVPVQRRNVGTVLQNHDERILALERERFVGGGNGYEIARELLRPADFVNVFGDGPQVTDFGTYSSVVAHCVVADALNDETVFAMRLGPQGAIYHLQFICKTGPDGGVFDFEWAQIPGSPDGGDSFPSNLVSSEIPGDPLDGAGMPYSPNDLYSILEWVTMAESGPAINESWDLYDAVGAANQIGGNSAVTGAKYQQFRIMGRPGDVMTQAGVADTNGGFANFTSDGGPGIYLLKVKAIDKDPASSGYVIRFSSLTINREFYDNFSL